MKYEFRIRWAIVTTLGANVDRRKRMCVAERRVKFLGFKFWMMLSNAHWRDSEAEALRDIAHYKDLHQPLPEVKYVK